MRILMVRLLSLAALMFGAPLEAQSFRLPAVPGLDEFFAIPEDNPLTPGRIALGRRLFYDPIVSQDSSLSCASCHLPDHAFADTVRLSVGARGRAGRRNAPSIMNRAYGASFFWDGRAESLEAQVLRPIADTLELDLPIDQLVDRLGRANTYREAFRREFADGTTATSVARALASYVRTLRSGEAPIDRYRGGDTTALSAEAKRGLALFVGRANCSVCHTGPNFTDEKFHNTGVAFGTKDVGRYAVSRRSSDRGAFKTPTLRNVDRTAPYMHDGSLATLQEVIDFYDRGGRANEYLDSDIHPLYLSTDEKQDLIALLRALTGPPVAK